MNTNVRRPMYLRLRYMILVDLACVLVAVVLAYVIRYEALIRVWPYVERNWPLFILAPVVRVLVYHAFRLYRRLWRYASIAELRAILLAGATSSAIIWLTDLLVLPLIRPDHVSSRSVLALETMLSVGALGATRLFYRLLQQRMTRDEATRLRAFVENPTRALIVGAGDAGTMILREAQSNPHLGIRVIGFVDDDANKADMSIHGVPVLGTRNDIPGLVRRHLVERVIIAMPTAPGKAIREIKAICQETGAHVQILPGMYELIGGRVSVSQVRDLRIEDLLRREPVQTDTQEVAGLLRQKRVLVTGAGGSIGGELCRQILRCGPEALVLLGHGENTIYSICNELRTMDPRLKITPVIADIRDRDRLASVFREHRPEVVFHAAAHKHVPLMEENVPDAVSNNVQGTMNVVDVAQDADVSHLVLISTDKAVNPTSVMGATKRLAEIIVQNAAARSGRNFVAVRFGNVLGSRGSVIPLFQQQIAQGGPVTVTHPDIKRYFMTIPEAVQLVLQAATLGAGGELFILDMGEPIRIVDLARDLIALSGFKEGRDIDIEFTGLRPGEKLYEELFREDESHRRTRHERIFVCQENAGPRTASPGRLDPLFQAARAGDVDRTRRELAVLLPEYEAALGAPSADNTLAAGGEGRRTAGYSPPLPVS